MAAAAARSSAAAHGDGARSVLPTRPTSVAGDDAMGTEAFPALSAEAPAKPATPETDTGTAAPDVRRWSKYALRHQPALTVEFWYLLPGCCLGRPMRCQRWSCDAPPLVAREARFRRRAPNRSTSRDRMAVGTTPSPVRASAMRPCSRMAVRVRRRSTRARRPTAVPYGAPRRSQSCQKSCGTVSARKRCALALPEGMDLEAGMVSPLT